MAGAEGFEPPLAVLETAGLPLNLRPYMYLAHNPKRVNSAGRDFFTAPSAPRAVRSLASTPTPVYLISLCGWCLRQNGQNFFSSTRSVMVFLFFMLV